MDVGNIAYDLHAWSLKVCINGIWQHVTVNLQAPAPPRVEKSLDYLEFYQDVQTPGPAIDVNVFKIDGEGIFASRTGQRKRDVSVIYKWTDEKFVRFQKIDTDAAQCWESFRINDNFVLIGNSVAVSVKESCTVSYSVATITVRHKVAVRAHSNNVQLKPSRLYFFAFANYGKTSDKPINSTIYKWHRRKKRFKEYQRIETWTARDFEFFVIGNDKFLAVANHAKGSNQQVDSVIYKWQPSTKTFQEYQRLSTIGAYDWTYFHVDEYHFLAVAQAFDGLSTLTDSRIYALQNNKFVLFQTMEGIKRNFTLEAENGMTMDAMEVFSTAIRYLKDQLLEQCERQQSGFNEDDILFVLTVPAIWTDQAKQFMREAAENAAIKKENLLIALEPEAASLFCKHVPVEKMVCSSVMGYDVFKPGSKYIVLDAGGGTIDITVHEVEHNGHLKEIHKANGGDWGGTKVDEAFRSLLADIVGEEVLQSFSKEFKYDMLDLFTGFEVKKRSITPDLKDKITLKVPISLVETFKNLNKGKEIKDILQANKKYAGKLSWIGDKLRMDADIAKDLYKETTDKIVHHMQKLAREHAVKDAKYILMVGGFSESPMLRDAIQKAFPQKRVIIPNEAGLSVLKGAIIYGHDPQIIDFRVCKYTYGVHTNTTFDMAIHDESKKFTTNDGRVKCKDLFSKHVEIGQKVVVGCPQSEKIYSVLEPDNTAVSFDVYISTEENPKYVTDPSCTYLGNLEIGIPGEGLDREATVCMTFSGTELKVEATDGQTGESFSAVFNLLE